MTTIRQYPPQPQPPAHPFGRNPAYANYNSLPTTPRMGPIPDKAPRDRPQQLPQQYAHPLQRTNSYPLRGSPKEGYAKAERAENMLRRKTPNGILAAAYDGSASVEQTDKPHAMKHILLPVTTADGAVQQPSRPYGPTQELPLRTPGMIQQGSHNQVQQRMLPGDNWDPSHFSFDPPTVSRKRGQQQFPQIDSMLNQVPTPQQQLQYLAMGQHFGGALQPPLQSPLGPTVSNETGLYGPYWPDGTYVPYRPAAVRDPRYYPTPPPSWNHQHSSFSNRVSGNWPPLGNLSLDTTNWKTQHPQLGQPVTPGAVGYNVIGAPFGPAQTFNTPNEQAWLSGQQQQHQHHHHQQPSQQYLPSTQNTLHNPYQNNIGQSNFQRPSLPPQSASYHPGDAASQGDLTPLATPFSDLGPTSNNAQLRERVLDWAHQIYIELLSYLHHSRRQGHHGRNLHGQPQPSIYPKPPRQPGADFTSSSKLSDHHRQQHVLNNGGIVEPNSALTHARTSSLWKDHQRRASWQQSMLSGAGIQQPVQPADAYRSLRRTSGTSFPSMYSSVTRDLPSNALSAIEQITQYCQESSWKWIDGILVGGCLAYALGDYQKALVWYSKILEIDPE